VCLRDLPRKTVAEGPTPTASTTVFGTMDGTAAFVGAGFQQMRAECTKVQVVSASCCDTWEEISC